jgi:hypothetical protein
MAYMNAWNKMKEVLRGKFIALSLHKEIEEVLHQQLNSIPEISRTKRKNTH